MESRLEKKKKRKKEKKGKIFRGIIITCTICILYFGLQVVNKSYGELMYTDERIFSLKGDLTKVCIEIFGNEYYLSFEKMKDDIFNLIDILQRLF
jgi:hypothetical protein